MSAIVDAYEAGAPKVWYSKLTVHRHYLICLFDAHRVFSLGKVLSIPHGCADQVYVDILDGKEPPRFQAQRFLQDIDDGSAAEAPPLAAPQAAPQEAAQAAPQPAELDDVDDAIWQEELLHALEQAFAVEEALEEEAVAPVGPEEAVAPATPPAPEVPGTLEADISVVGKWGPFSFGHGDKAWTFGGAPASYSIRCLCHRRNEKTECKKQIRVEDGDRDMCLRKLALWAVTGKDYSRQWAHIAFTPTNVGVPSLAVLKAMRDSAVVATKHEIKTDVELDMAGIDFNAKPPESWALCEAAPAPPTPPLDYPGESIGRARGRGRARGGVVSGSRGRGRGRGRGASSSSSESSDSSSSTSS